MKNKYEDVSEPVEELVTLVYNHFGTNPMGWTGIDKLAEYAHNSQFVSRVFELHEYLLNSEELLLGINPSQYYKIIYKFQLASKSLDYDIKKIEECYLYLANYSIKVYNYFGEHLIEKSAAYKFIEVTSELQVRQLSLLCAALRSYSEILFCDEHTIAGEIYAPMKIEDDIMIVRKYRHLNALELRDELKDFPYKEITIYIRYKNIGKPIYTDIVGNLLIDIDITKFMSSFYLEVVDNKGNIMDLDSHEKIMEEIIEYLKYISPLLSKQYKKMEMEDRLWLKIVSEYYAMKPYADILLKEWEPVPYILDINAFSNANREIVKANLELEDMQHQEDTKKKLFILNDPRIHW